MPARISRGLSRNGRRPPAARGGTPPTEARAAGVAMAGGRDAPYSFAPSRSFSSVMNSPMSRKCRYTEAKRT